MPSRTSLATLIAALGLLGAASTADAQRITGISVYNTLNGNLVGTWRTNTQGGDFFSNTYITRGTSPATDAFVYTGNASGNLLGAGLLLNPGVNTFYIWGFTGLGSADWGISLMSGSNVPSSLPTLSSWYSATQNTLSSEGKTGGNDFGGVTPGGALSALIDGATVTITEWSFAQVSRPVFIGSYDVSSSGSAVTNNVGKLVLTVVPPVSAVPEPSSIALVATGGLLLMVARRRRTAALR